MKQGTATTKIIELIGGDEEWCKNFVDLYWDTKRRLNGPSAVETVLTQFAKIHKALYMLRKRGYLTEEGELAVYDALLKNLDVYEKPQLLVDLIVRISGPHKTGPQFDHALNILIAELKSFYDKKGLREPFWPILPHFLEEQGIMLAGETNSDALKVGYQRFVNAYEALSDTEKASIASHKDYFSNYLVPLEVSKLRDIPKNDRPKKIEALLNPRLVRDYLNRIEIK